MKHGVLNGKKPGKVKKRKECFVVEAWDVVLKSTDAIFWQENEPYNLR